MKKLIAVVVLAIATSANAQIVTAVISTGVSVARFVLDVTDKDKLENTPPVTVQASGTGETCDAALTNAKRFALEKVNGTWVRSMEQSKDGSYNEEIIQYSGGVIKSYKYLRNDCTFVIIEAEVQKRSNRVQLESADITKDQIIHLQGIKENNDRKAIAIRKLDSRQQAVYFAPSKTEMRLIDGTNDVAVVITGKFAYTDKWRADYLELREMIGFFNLPSFEPHARVVITGFDSTKHEVYKASFVQEHEWTLWKRRSYGAMPQMEVYTNKTEEVNVKFRIPYNQLQNVSSFNIGVI